MRPLSGEVDSYEALLRTPASVAARLAWMASLAISATPLTLAVEGMWLSLPIGLGIGGALGYSFAVFMTRRISLRSSPVVTLKERRQSMRWLAAGAVFPLIGMYVLASIFLGMVAKA